MWFFEDSLFMPHPWQWHGILSGLVLACPLPRRVGRTFTPTEPMRGRSPKYGENLSASVKPVLWPESSKYCATGDCKMYQRLIHSHFVSFPLSSNTQLQGNRPGILDRYIVFWPQISVPVEPRPTRHDHPQHHYLES